MWHRVAALLGRTVDELRGAMSSAEFSDWCAFYDLEPWGFDADNWRMSVVAATTANYSGRVKKALKPSAFLPKRGRVPKQQSAEQIEQTLRRVAVEPSETNGE